MNFNKIKRMRNMNKVVMALAMLVMAWGDSVYQSSIFTYPDLATATAEVGDLPSGAVVQVVNGGLYHVAGGALVATASGEMPEVYDDTTLTGRVETLENAPDNDTVYDDTAVIGRLDVIETAPDNDTVYDDTAITSRVETLENAPDNDTIYDDSAITGRVATLENTPDNDTIYDDSAVLGRLDVVEADASGFLRVNNSRGEATINDAAVIFGREVEFGNDVNFLNPGGLTNFFTGVSFQEGVVFRADTAVNLPFDTRKPTNSQNVINLNPRLILNAEESDARYARIGAGGGSLNILYIAQSNGRGRYGGGGDLATNELVKVQNYATNTVELWTPESDAPAQIRGGNGNNNLLFHFAKTLAEKFGTETISACSLEEAQPIQEWLSGGSQRAGLEDLITNHPVSSRNDAVKFDLVFFCQGESDAFNIDAGTETVAGYEANFLQLRDDLVSLGAISVETQWIITEQTRAVPQGNLNDTFWNTLEWPFTVIPSRNLPTPSNDLIHYEGISQVIMGRQMALDAYMGDRFIAIPVDGSVINNVSGFNHDIDTIRNLSAKGSNIDSRVSVSDGVVNIEVDSINHGDFAFDITGGEVYVDALEVLTAEVSANQADGVLLSGGGLLDISSREMTFFNSGSNDIHGLNLDEGRMFIRANSVTQLGSPDFIDFDGAGGEVHFFPYQEGRKIRLTGNRRFIEATGDLDAAEFVVKLAFYADTEWRGDPTLSASMFQTTSSVLPEIELFIKAGCVLTSNQELPASVAITGGGTFVFDPAL